MLARTLPGDVRLLGDTLGDVLRAHGGEPLFEAVERMRGAAKRARENGSQEARRELASVAASLEPRLALDVVRAFTLYFQLVNQAEDVHRTREVRRRESAREPVAESLASVAAELQAKGATYEETLRALEDVNLSFVFTAHPTEARRRTTERLLADVRVGLETLDRTSPTPPEERRLHRRLRATVEALWEHASERSEKPTVLDEVKTGVWYLRNVLLDVVPEVQRSLARALESAFAEPVDPASLPSPVVFGSWMGGDRDGNPFVDDATLERTLEIHRFICVDRYLKDVDALVDPLATAASRLPPCEALDRAIARAEAAVPEVAGAAERRNGEEPLRRLLVLVRDRLERTQSGAAGRYTHPADLLDDLQAMRTALRGAGAFALPNDALLDLVLRVRVFGFHLAALDAREDSAVHRAVVAELLGDPRYPELPANERIAALSRLRLPARGTKLSPEARRCLSLFETLAACQARFGREACHTYIISMTESEADVHEVWRLLELHGIADHVDVVPLFETREALESTVPILSSLLRHPGYREHVRRRGDLQELLVGYSDSMRQNGTLASRILVLETQRSATRVCTTHGVKLRVFHGRGGSTSRGGGPTYRAIRALPPEVFSGDTKITEQGEVRSFHFASPDLAARYLEQTIGAALYTRYEARYAPRPEVSEENALMPRLAETSGRAYRALVEDEGLVPYFASATPFPVIAQLNIASRPSKRGGGALTLARLRAIPWVFAWSQQRSVITGWYGVGTALAELSDDEVHALVAHSPFFRDVIDNVEMTLAKSDLAIAARYAELCDDATVRDRIRGAIEREHAVTVREVLRATQATHVLDDDQVIRSSIELRNPYVDPLSYLQIEALRRAREGEEGWNDVARAAVHGIAAGLRNTG
ncbi:MAG: phosphoenolpyruvate carboxylase [Sandaracinus sp.]|nr:phosphoenolpyruvate carboxylase [Sandaracinus sp.]MCB9632090.1 phosphoenolpyruvate carboxylase [Sandaracinus sp.]